MANEIKSKFSLVDEMSEKLDKIADTAEQMLEKFGDLADRANSFFNDMATSLDDYVDKMNESASAVEDYTSDMADSISGISDSTADIMDSMQDMGDEVDNATSKASDALDGMGESAQHLGATVQDAGDKTSSSMDDAVQSILALKQLEAFTVIEGKLKQLGSEAIAMAEQFEESKSTIVEATGATGEALEGLREVASSVYSTTEYDLGSVSGVIGEVNTRLGSTGDILDEQTRMFLKFGEATGQNATSSVRSVTQMMRQWGIESENMNVLLDKLTVAGQVSGISVGSLSSQLVNQKGVLDQLGFSLDDAIAMFSNFELAGVRTQSVIMGFRQAMAKGAISSLQDLEAIFNKISTGAMSASEASKIFGTRAGVEIVNAVEMGVLSLDDMRSTLEQAEGKLEETSETSQTFKENWTAATNSVSSAFQKAVAPAVEKLGNGLANIVGKIGSFLTDHPKLTKALTAIGIGLGVVVGAITAIGIATKLAQAIIVPAIQIISGAVEASPIGWIALAIGGVVAAITALIAMSDDFIDETYYMTEATRENYQAVQDQQAEYDRMVEQYGEASTEAAEAKVKLDELTDTYERNYETIEQYQERMQGIIDSHKQMMDSFVEMDTTIETDNVKINALIGNLEQLITTSDGTVGSQEAIKKIIDELNGSLDGLNLSYEKLMSNPLSAMEELKAFAQAQHEADKASAAVEKYVQAVQDLEVGKDAAEENSKKVEELTEKYETAKQEYIDWQKAMWATGYNPAMDIDTTQSYLVRIKELYNELEVAQEAQEGLDQAIEESQDIIDETEQLWRDQQDALDKATEAEKEAAQAVSDMEGAYSGVIEVVNDFSDTIEGTVKAYEDAYNAAYTSMQGQFGLFDEANMKSETYLNSTVENATTALQTQADYWSTYAENINFLKDKSAEDLGITQENYDLLMSQVQDGSEQAAGLAASIVDSLQNGGEAGQEAVANLATSMGEIDAKQQEIAANTAEWKTGFQAEMDEIYEMMSEGVTKLDCSKQAKVAAQKTITEYIGSIKDGGSSAITEAQTVAQGAVDNLYANATQSGVNTLNTYIQGLQSAGEGAVSYAQQLANRITAALGKANVKINAQTPIEGNARGTLNSANLFIAGEKGYELVRTVHGYANGTTNAEGEFFMAGENGPELIAGQQGATVFPHSETDRLIGALNGMNSSREPMMVMPDSTSNRSGGGDKNITINIEGGGSIKVDASVDKKSILATLQENLKPVLMGIIQQEMYEEGDYSYEF